MAVFVNLTATPASLVDLPRWNGDAIEVIQNTAITMDRTKRVQGIFGTPLPTATIGDGRVQTDPAAALFPFALDVRLTGIPRRKLFRPLDE